MIHCSRSLPVTETTENFEYLVRLPSMLGGNQIWSTPEGMVEYLLPIYYSKGRVSFTRFAAIMDESCFKLTERRQRNKSEWVKASRTGYASTSKERNAASLSLTLMMISCLPVWVHLPLQCATLRNNIMMTLHTLYGVRRWCRLKSKLR